jgi:hypothetical protein|tara:strand:- start:919 stop:1086 length:168 start_codon:yes stop_codon:yes gene_type:complete
LDAFDETSGSKAYGAAASSFATGVTSKKEITNIDTDPEAAAAVAAPAAEEKQAAK